MFVRRETPADRDGVFAVHEAAFATPMEARLVDQLRSDGDVVPELSLVAEIDGQVAGHVVCSRATIAGQPVLGLGPLGVLPAHQRAGVGSALVHAVVAAADALGAPAVVLLGSPGYYGRFGFVLASPLGVIPPNPDWAPHWQIRTLSAWTGLRGEFRYAPAFG